MPLSNMQLPLTFTNSAKKKKKKAYMIYWYFSTRHPYATDSDVVGTSGLAINWRCIDPDKSGPRGFPAAQFPFYLPINSLQLENSS